MQHPSRRPGIAGASGCFRQLRWRIAGGSLLPVVTLAIFSALGACTTRPLVPYSVDTPPLILLPASEAGVQDRRPRFREIFCQVLEARGPTLPDYRPCAEALTRVGMEPAGTGAPVSLEPSKRHLVALVVPGVGSDCFAHWLDSKGSVAGHLQQFGYDQVSVQVDGLSGSANNARQIRDAILGIPSQGPEPRLVLIGYSKGATDILQAVVSYPEIHPRVAAVVSAAGSVGGSPLANNLKQSLLALIKNWPGAQCSPGDGGAAESLRPGTRKNWLAENLLPRDLPYYSVVTFPQPERISSILKPSYNLLSQVDARNDSQLLFYDQVIPGSTLLAYVNADHWAVALPIARSHRVLGSTFVDRNDYPREALTEAILRFVEEDLAESAR